MFFFFCKHKWEFLSETTTESRAEASARLTEFVPRPMDRYDLDPLYGKQLIQIVACTKCGKLKRFITDI